MYFLQLLHSNFLSTCSVAIAILETVCHSEIICTIVFTIYLGLYCFQKTWTRMVQLINIHFYQISFSTIDTPNHRRSSGSKFQYFQSSHVALSFVKCALQTVDCQVFCLFAMLWDLTGSGANPMCLLQSALIETPVSQTEKWTYQV